jgi:hypothetical protein
MASSSVFAIVVQPALTAHGSGHSAPGLSQASLMDTPIHLKSNANFIGIAIAAASPLS